MATYNPKKIIFTYGGQTITGFADGSAIEVARNQDSYALAVGVDGKGARVASADKSGRITVTLMQSSPSNDVLTGLMRVDEATDLGSLPIFFKDVSGTTYASASSAWIVKPPEMAFNKEMGERVWIFETLDLDIFIGGNPI